MTADTNIKDIPQRARQFGGTADRTRINRIVSRTLIAFRNREKFLPEGGISRANRREACYGEGTSRQPTGVVRGITRPCVVFDSVYVIAQLAEGAAWL